MLAVELADANYFLRARQGPLNALLSSGSSLASAPCKVAGSNFPMGTTSERLDQEDRAIKRNN